MARKSFFSKITDIVLERDDNEESVEDIDRRVEAEIAAIQSQKQEEVDGAKMLKDDFNADDDTAFIMDLGPLYTVIGGRTGMLGRRLPDSCENIFDRLVPATEGRGRVRADYFFMTFVEPSREKGFRRAAEIINEIGALTIGERFKEIEVPGLLVAADPSALADEDGALDLSKVQEHVEAGGAGVVLGAPGADDPVWLKLSVEKANKTAKLVGATKGNDDDSDDTPRPRRRGDPDWVEERTERRVKISMDPMQMERRSGRDRRANR